jgi:hypothetical protein
MKLLIMHLHLSRNQMFSSAPCPQTPLISVPPLISCNVMSCYICSRHSAVGIATGYGLDDRGVGVWIPIGSRIFFSPQGLDRLWGPPSLLTVEYRGPLSPGVKRPGREADHSRPTSAEVKKTFIYTSTPPYIFVA